MGPTTDPTEAILVNVPCIVDRLDGQALAELREVPVLELAEQRVVHRSPLRPEAPVTATRTPRWAVIALVPLSFVGLSALTS